jgi:hypothetical protein
VKASNTEKNAQFGHVVALSADGNTMAVSAYFDASNATGINGNQADESIPQAGAVYVFARRGTSWSQQAYIKASNTGEAGTGNEFGDDRILSAIRSNSRRQASDLVAAIAAGVEAFCGRISPEDDVSVLVVKRLPPAAAPEAAGGPVTLP